MTELSIFLDMGGYARFIWPSYGIVAVVLAGLFIISRRELRAAQRDLEALDAPDNAPADSGGGQ